jgi:hypothetical protein
MLVMEVPVHQVIRMPGVRNRFVPAARAVHVGILMAAAGVLGRAAVGIARGIRKLVAIRVTVVHVVHMPFVQVIGVTLVLDRGMTACGIVHMRVSFVRLTSHTRCYCRIPPDGVTVPTYRLPNEFRGASTRAMCGPRHGSPGAIGRFPKASVEIANCGIRRAPQALRRPAREIGRPPEPVVRQHMPCSTGAIVGRPALSSEYLPAGTLRGLIAGGRRQ